MKIRKYDDYLYRYFSLFLLLVKLIINLIFTLFFLLFYSTILSSTFSLYRYPLCWDWVRPFSVSVFFFFFLLLLYVQRGQILYSSTIVSPSPGSVRGSLGSLSQFPGSSSTLPFRCTFLGDYPYPSNTHKLSL